VLNLAKNNLGGWNGEPGSDSKHDTTGNTNNTATRHQCTHDFHVPAGIIALAGVIPGMGALVCADIAGKYYHEWRLNPRHNEVEAVFLRLDGDGDELKYTPADWATPLADSFEPNTPLDVVIASPVLADGDITNSTHLNGKVALVDRGGCSFVEKAQRVQAAGAIAMICVNNDKEGPDEPPGMANGGVDTSDITISAIIISFNNGTKIKSGTSVIYHVKTPFKFVSPAPDVGGQDEDPSVPLDYGICHHCGQPKDQHHAKGALIKLDISMNNIRAEQKGDLQRICVASGVELVI
jgi:hypothetical protein